MLAFAVWSQVNQHPELPVAGVVLLGAYFHLNEHDDFRVPVMTANGDLDGSLRITETMNSFRWCAARCPYMYIHVNIRCWHT